MKMFYIYRNLRTRGFSIRYDGIVIDRLNSILVDDVVFKVNTSGRERVLLEKQKNVHAFVVAKSYSCINSISVPLNVLEEVSYNPYRDGCFYIKNTGEPIYCANSVLLHMGKCYLIKRS